MKSKNDINAQTAQTSINKNGRIVIPFRIRRALGLEPGDTVTLTLEDGTLRIEPHHVTIRRIQAELQPFAPPGILASDELAADRREEVRSEMEEWLG